MQGKIRAYSSFFSACQGSRKPQIFDRILYWLGLTLIYMFKRINKSFEDKINSSLFLVLLFLYFLVLVWVIMFHLSGYTGLETYYHALENNYSISYRFGINRIYEYNLMSLLFWSDIFINILLFIPMGSLLILKAFKKSSFLKCFSIALLTSIVFEISQVFTRLGSFSYFDIIFNLIGSIIGYFIFKLINSKCTFKIINYSVLTLTIIFIPVIIFAITSLCLNWDMFKVFFDFKTYPYIW